MGMVKQLLYKFSKIFKATTLERVKSLLNFDLKFYNLNNLKALFLMVFF